MSVLDRIPPRADHRLSYGTLPLQFGDLRVPVLHGAERAPVLVMVHGGWWQNTYDLSYLGFACEADVSAGFDHVAELATRYPLDVARVAVAGHSAGGQLAFWLAGRDHIPESSPLHVARSRLRPKAVVGLAGAVDLRLCVELGGIFRFTRAKPMAESLVGGSPIELPERYRAANPGDLLPFGVPQTLLQGSEDDQIPPELSRRWVEMAKRQGDRAQMELLRDADHFDVVDPESKAWPAVLKALVGAVNG